MVIYITIINGVCKDKLVSDACDLYCVMAVKEISADVVTYNSLIYGLCIVEGKVKEAKNTLALMLKAHLKPDVVTYNNGRLFFNEVKNAKQVFKAMAQRGDKRVDEAILFKEMHQKNMVLDTVTYNSLVDGLCKSGRIPYVWNLIDEMQRSTNKCNR
ncbi:hypothetical protein JHK87_021433 [Glycine soja]|nr:hypothetical protein JHK87_021433 [Glycine soja]